MVPVTARSVGNCRRSSPVFCFILALAAACAGEASANPLGEMVAAAPSVPAQAATTVADASATPHPSEVVKGSKQRTRFVIALERATNFQVFALANPNRVVVDLPDVKVQLPSISGDTPVGLIKSFRGGLAAPGKMRVVIDVTEPVIVEKSSLEPGKDKTSPRLVLEIIPVEASKLPAKKAPEKVAHTAAAVPPLQPPLPKPAVRPEARAAASYKPIIVLDPGHGGHDGGAVRNGAVEKDVVLAFAQALRNKLNATGRYKVLMTRDNDTFVPLNERREFAERNKAALFIAVHADYAGSQARGATIYSLRDSVANELKRSASGEVASSVMTDKELKAMRLGGEPDAATLSMLADLAKTEVQVTKERTSVFARSVIEFMGTSTNMMSNPDRSAAFAVLRTAKVPAVLIELAYVSNKQDAAQLMSDQWRNKVSGSIVTAIENYFSHQVARLPM